jgi:hypothetical protein
MTSYQFNASRTSSISNCFLLPISLISIFTSHNHRKFKAKLSVLLILKPHHVQNTSATIPNLVKIERAPNYSTIEGITRKKEPLNNRPSGNNKQLSRSFQNIASKTGR